MTCQIGVFMAGDHNALKEIRREGFQSWERRES